MITSTSSPDHSVFLRHSCQVRASVNELKRVTRFIERTNCHVCELDELSFFSITSARTTRRRNRTDSHISDKILMQRLGTLSRHLYRLASDHCRAIKRACDVIMHLFLKKKKKKIPRKKKTKQCNPTADQPKSLSEAFLALLTYTLSPHFSHFIVSTPHTCQELRI